MEADVRNEASQEVVEMHAENSADAEQKEENDYQEPVEEDIAGADNEEPVADATQSLSQNQKMEQDELNQEE